MGSLYLYLFTIKRCASVLFTYLLFATDLVCLQLCHVLYDFTARGSSEVSVSEGSVVCVLQRSDLDGNAEWWLVLRDDGCRGYAPANYLLPVTTKN